MNLATIICNDIADWLKEIENDITLSVHSKPESWCNIDDMCDVDGALYVSGRDILWILFIRSDMVFEVYSKTYEYRDWVNVARQWTPAISGSLSNPDSVNLIKDHIAAFFRQSLAIETGDGKNMSIAAIICNDIASWLKETVSDDSLLINVTNPDQSDDYQGNIGGILHVVLHDSFWVLYINNNMTFEAYSKIYDDSGWTYPILFQRIPSTNKSQWVPTISGSLSDPNSIDLIKDHINKLIEFLKFPKNL